MKESDILKEKSSLLEAVFTRIRHQRMAGMPVLNQRLGIHAIGFRFREENIVGVLATPWFMNLMLLPYPDKTSAWDSLQELTKVQQQFPSGNYEFTVGFEEEIGKYQMCSLFSPMFEFVDDEAVIDTAHAALAALMDEDNQVQPDIDTRRTTQAWLATGNETATAPNLSGASGNAAAGLAEKMQIPITRRDLLRGALLSGGESER